MAHTLKEIAKELDMSVATVSRVINGKCNVNDSTRKRVLDAIKQSGYKPNFIARSLRTNKTKTIGVIVPDISEVFFAKIIKGIDNVMSKRGYSIILADTQESVSRENAYIDMLMQHKVDALVIATVSMDGGKIAEVMRSGIPVVFIDNLPNLHEAYDAVLIDNRYAGALAARHFLDAGHSNIAFIAGKQNETTGFERLSGFGEAFMERNLPVNEDLIAYGDFKEESGFACMNELLDKRDRNPFSAVCVASEMMTFGAVKAIFKRGLRIPDDIALVGFDIHDNTGMISPSITTVRQPETRIGVLTGELLIKRLEADMESADSVRELPRKLLLTPELEVHQSCGSKSHSK